MMKLSLVALPDDARQEVRSLVRRGSERAQHINRVARFAVYPLQGHFRMNRATLLS